MKCFTDLFGMETCTNLHVVLSLVKCTPSNDAMLMYLLKRITSTLTNTIRP